MKILIFIVGFISSIVALIAINTTAINEAVYYRLFVIVTVCSVVSILACLLLYSGGGWQRYILFSGVYSIYNVICRCFGYMI